MDLFMLNKSILEYGIKELEENNFKLDRNPFEEIEGDFRVDCTLDYISYFNEIGRPEFGELITG